VVVIVLDTNILVASPKLASHAWSSLIQNAQEWDVRIVVPEVVVMETINVVTRNWSGKRAKAAALELGVFDVGEARAVLLSEMDRKISSYGEFLRDRLERGGVEILRTPDVAHIDVATRASEGRAPFTKDKDGYRDTLIWYTVLAAADRYPASDIWFVSDNTDDFGPRQPDWTGGGQGDREDCPILFHSDLAAELEEGGLSDRVRYVVSLARLEQHIASQYGPIVQDELAALAGAVNSDDLTGQLARAVIGIALDAEDAALPFDVFVATIIGSRPPTHDWKFSEGARRGESGWTARFLVDSEVDIVMTGSSLDRRVDTKELRLTGQVTVSSEGQLLDLVVDAAQALPGDPLRAQWAELESHGAAPFQVLSTLDLALNAGRDARAIKYAIPTFNTVADILREQQAEQARLIKASLPTFTKVAEILQDQEAERAKFIRDSLPTFTKMAQALQDQEAQRARMIQDALPTLNSIARVFREHDEPDSNSGTRTDVEAEA
jgi:predicted nucleic acid-binding protein